MGMVWGGLALAVLAGRAAAQDQQQLQQQANQLQQQSQLLQKQSQQLQKQVQQQAQGGAARTAQAPTSDAFDRACVDLLHGKTPQGEAAIKALRDACASLMSGRADERIQAEQKRQAAAAMRAQAQQPAVQPGRSTAQPQQGEGVLAAFGSAASELATSRTSQPLGMRQGGPVHYLLSTNPVGYFNGLGFNAELWGAIEEAPKFSWVGGLRYSGTDTSTGSATTFGAEAGLDWFITGQRNEGLRVGPRVELAAGREHNDSNDTNNTFARVGLGGELGYNFIASNGISGLLAVGLGGRIAGDSTNDNFASFVGGEFGPYAKVGIGFGW